MFSGSEEGTDVSAEGGFRPAAPQPGGMHDVPCFSPNAPVEGPPRVSLGDTVWARHVGGSTAIQPRCGGPRMAAATPASEGDAAEPVDTEEPSPEARCLLSPGGNLLSRSKPLSIPPRHLQGERQTPPRDLGCHWAAGTAVGRNPVAQELRLLHAQRERKGCWRSGYRRGVSQGASAPAPPSKSKVPLSAPLLFGARCGVRCLPSGFSVPLTVAAAVVTQLKCGLCRVGW